VNVRSDRGRFVERPRADEAHLGSTVLAEDRDLARRAAVDPLRAAVVAGTSTGCGSPASSSTRSASISRLITNALPVCRWQLRQWQQWTNIGSDVSR
jgi:hypothetical protein